MKNLITFGEIMMRLATKGYLRFSQANSFDIIYISNWLVNGPPFEFFASHTNTYTTYAAFVGFLFNK